MAGNDPFDNIGNAIADSIRHKPTLVRLRLTQAILGKLMLGQTQEFTARGIHILIVPPVPKTRRQH